MKFFRLFAVSLIMAAPLRAQDKAASGSQPTPTPTASGPLRMVLGSPLAITQQPLLLTGRFGKWFPVSVLLTNTGDPVSGEVRLRLTSTSNFQSKDLPAEFFARVDLPSNSRKEVWLYGRLERMETTGIEVTFSGRGFNTLKQDVDLRAIDATQRLVLNVTDRDDNLNYLSGFKGKGLGLFEDPRSMGNQPQIRPLTTTRDMIPDRWIGFDAVDLLVLGDFPHAQLLPAQADAVRGYARGGGNLLVPSGARWQVLAQSPLADLWPVKLGAATAANADETARLAGNYIPSPRDGADRLGGSPVVLSRGALQNGGHPLNGAPFLTIGDTGAGRCLMLGYDPAQPPFGGWRGLLPLWRNIFAAEIHPTRLETIEAAGAFGRGNAMYGNAAYGSDEATQSNTNILYSVMRQAQQLRMPPVSQVAWFLALYVFVLVPVNYTVLRYYDRRELAWVTIPVIVLVFSVFAYEAALSIRGRAILTRQVDVVQGSIGPGQARVDSLSWLFSPRHTTYDISAHGKGDAIAEYIYDVNLQASVSIEQPGDGGPFVDQGVPLLQWTERPFVGQSLVDLKGGVQLLSGKTLTLKNGTPFDLTGAVLVRQNHATPFGNLVAGAKSEAKPGGWDNVSGHDLTAALLDYAKLDKTFKGSFEGKDIPVALLNAMAPVAQLSAGHGTLVAWGERAVSGVTFAGQPNSQQVTLFMLRLP